MAADPSLIELEWAMPEVLFVCSVNRFRSVIAAEYFRLLLRRENVQGDWQIGSAGTWANEGLPPLQETVQLAQSKGFEVGTIRSQEINRNLLERVDLIIVMGEGHREALSLEFPEIKEKIVLLSEVCVDELYDIPDLGENVDDTAEGLGEEICALLDQGYAQIVTRALKNSKKKKVS